MELTGGCLCGGVRFEVTPPFIRANHCHCSRCRKHSGAFGLTQGRVPRDGFRLLAGEELIREWRPPDGFAKVFCSACGSALWSRHPEDSDVIGVRLGTFDGDPGIRPQYRQYVAYAAPWEPLPDDGLPRFPEGRSS